MNKKDRDIAFTGERMVPELAPNIGPFYEHLERYLFAAGAVKDKIILDAGCGVGYGSYILARYGKAKEVVGVDSSAETISYANRKYRGLGITFLKNNVEKLDVVGKDEFDIVVAFEIIEHLANPDKFLLQVKKVLKEKGVLFISTPNKKASSQNNQFHIREYTKNQLEKLLKKKFKYVSFYFQKFELVTQIRKEQTKNFKFIGDFVRNNHEVYQTLVDPENEQYFICLCSDQQLPNLNSISMTTSQADGFNLKQGLLSLGEQFAKQGSPRHLIKNLFRSLKLRAKKIQRHVEPH